MTPPRNTNTAPGLPLAAPARPQTSSGTISTLIPLDRATLAPKATPATLDELQGNIDSLKELHGKLRFMLRELESLVDLKNL